MKKPMQPDEQKAATEPPLHWTERWRASVPTRDALAANPWLKPIAHRVLDPKLWRMHHEAVARGAAIGVFWAFAVPVAQILIAAAHSVWWRGNIPVAVGVTLITNPLTIGFWLWLAYKAGGMVLSAPPPIRPAEGSGIMDYITSIGAPAILGMGMFAVGGALTAYVGVKVVWRLQLFFKHKRRTARMKSAAQERSK